MIGSPEMHGLPDDADLTFLVGKTLNQVGVGRNDVGLYFDGPKTSIMIEATSAVENGSEVTASDNSFVIAPAMFPLIGRTVTDISWNRSGMVRLTFDDGAVLVIEDDSPHYESYQIVHGDLRITV
ncbi:DUF6188 family protein [Actinotalea sp. Marseille-Q4924]|uniref:DUF6188 family protein n=1 Tax=Actinotalea sp. Marseille-Q4924 TaxID=2866571 RepID=UPI001CE43AAB|nr:DUF6188 family protein [Actinotalea sp. Marseille-Q4924]